MNICTKNYLHFSGLQGCNFVHDEETNRLCASICKSAFERGLDALELLEELSDNHIPFEIQRGEGSGWLNGKFYRSCIITINVGTGGDVLWVYCDK